MVRETVLENERVQVLLRRVEGKAAAQHAHPATIADVRIAHILASLTHTDGDGGRQLTIRSTHVYDLAEGIARALGKATPADEVIAIAFARDRRLGIFSDDRVTALRTYLEGDELLIEFFALEEPREDERPGRRGEYRAPLALPAARARFSIVPGEAQRVHGERGVAVAWRDDYYRRPVSLRFREGQIKRRTVLMEMPAEDAPGAAAASRDAGSGALGDQQRRALQELEALRREGEITESEYGRRRRLIERGELPGAGDPEP